MVLKIKKHLTLNIDSEIAEKAVADPTINISEITEKLLKAFTTSSKTADKKKLYEMYQELFNLMLPLLKKFKVNTPIAHIFFEEAPDETFLYVMPNEERHSIDFSSVWLEPDGSFTSDSRFDYEKITDIPIEDFDKPKQILDQLLYSIRRGVDYRKEQFKEIEMAKIIIDTISKTVLPKSKKIKRGKRR